jgi:hypothetical protein
MGGSRCVSVPDDHRPQARLLGPAAALSQIGEVDRLLEIDDMARR